MPAAGERVAIDTSVAIPLLVRTHHAHDDVVSWWAGRELALAGHAQAEIYSVLTRLPADLRLAPADAASLLEQRFSAPLLPSPDLLATLPRRLADAGVAGGAVYDALVGLAATEHGVTLATRDRRARSTYEAVGARVEIAAGA